MSNTFEIKVGQNTHTIVSDITEQENDRCGVTYHQLSRIQISPYLSAGMYRDTLFHEVMHTVSHFVGIKDEDKLAEEEWVSRTASALLTVLKENPELLEKLELCQKYRSLN